MRIQPAEVDIPSGADDGGEGDVVADAVGEEGVQADQVGEQGDEHGDAVGDEKVLGLVGVDVGWGAGGDVCGLTRGEQRAADEAEGEVGGEFGDEDVEGAVAGEGHVLQSLRGEGLGAVLLREVVVSDEVGVEVGGAEEGGLVDAGRDLAVGAVRNDLVVGVVGGDVLVETHCAGELIAESPHDGTVRDVDLVSGRVGGLCWVGCGVVQVKVEEVQGLDPVQPREINLVGGIMHLAK